MKDTICNICGHPCLLGPLPGVPKDGRLDINIKADMVANPYYWDEGGLINCRVMGGYNSTPGNGEGALDDCTSYTFSICEFCLDYLFTKMIIPPAVHQVFGLFEIDEEKTKEHPEVFRSAAQRVKEDEWRKHKKEFEDERFRRATSRKLMW